MNHRKKSGIVCDLAEGFSNSAPGGQYQWHPERSSKGPVTVLISGADRELYVQHNGEPIGRCAIEIDGRGKLGGHGFSLLDGATEKPSWWAPSRKARKWMTVDTDRSRGVASFDDLGKRLRVNPEFAGKLYDALSPGATVVVTDAAAMRNTGRDFTVLAN